MNGHAKGTGHQRNHHQASAQTQHSRRPSGNAAHPRQQGSRHRRLTVLGIRWLAGAHGQGEHDVHQGLHGQERPFRNDACQSSEDDRGRKGRETDRQTRPDRQMTGPQMGDRPRHRCGNNGEAAGSQGLGCGEIQPQQERRKDQSTTDAQQTGQTPSQEPQTDQQWDIPPRQHSVMTHRPPA